MARKKSTSNEAPPSAEKPVEAAPVADATLEEVAAADAVAEDGEAGTFELGDEQLPWLESEDDDPEEGVDTARIVGFALIGLILLAAIVGGIWYASRDRTDPEMIADGGTIEAPEGPYKERPENPGGKVHEGTGDTSFAVAEGQTRESRVANEPVAKPSIDREQSAAPADTGGVGVQVAAYSSREAAERGWQQLVGQYSALSGLKHRVVEGKADIGTVYRLQAVTANAGAANALCTKLKSTGGACQVKN